MTRLLHINVFRSTMDPKPLWTRELSWPDVQRILTGRLLVQNKDAASLFSFAVLGGDGKRRNDNVTGLDALVLDFDSGASPDEIDARFSRYERAFYSTHSHTADHPRFRLVLPFAACVSPEDYRRAFGQTDCRENRYFKIAGSANEGDT